MAQKTPLYRVQRRFTLNLERVANLLALYNLDLKSRPEIDSSRKVDLLRSAVVFMHSSLEDLLREVLRYAKPVNHKSFSKHLKLQDNNNKRSEHAEFNMADLVRFRGQSVESLLEKSVDRYLERKTFSHVSEVKAVLDLLELPHDDFNECFAPIGACIARRHKIVHESDRSARNTDTHGKPNTISEEEVTAWAMAIRQFGNGIFQKITP